MSRKYSRTYLEIRKLYVLFMTALYLGPAFAQTPNVLEDSYTSVQLDFYVPFLTTSETSPNLSRGKLLTFDGPSALNFSADAPDPSQNLGTYTPGEISGFASADFRALRARFNMEGGNAWKADVSANAHEVFTVVSDPALNGTAGSMTFVYSVSGTTNASVHIGAPAHPTRPADYDVSTYALSMTKYTPAAHPADPVVQTVINSYGDRTQGYDFLTTLAGGGAVVPTNTFAPLQTFEVDFIYGEPVALQTQFYIGAELDRELISGANPLRFLAQEYIIDDFEMDFSNTVSLTAIVNELHPNAQVFGVNDDYTNLVRATLPQAVPLPAGLFLIIAPIALLLRGRNSKTI